jgi:hypothetical protein
VICSTESKKQKLKRFILERDFVKRSAANGEIATKRNLSARLLILYLQYSTQCIHEKRKSSVVVCDTNSWFAIALDPPLDHH